MAVHILCFCLDLSWCRPTFDLHPQQTWNCEHWNFKLLSIILFHQNKGNINYYNIPICHPHDPSNMFGKMYFNEQRFSFCCWASPSSITNLALLQIFIRIKIDIVWMKAHLYEYLCKSGRHIHMNTSCFPTDLCKENVNKLNPLLFECKVMSHQIPSGQSTK